jgi:hypothetical protein
MVDDFESVQKSHLPVQRSNIPAFSWDYIGFKNCFLFNQLISSCPGSSDLTPRGRVVALFDALDNLFCTSVIRFVPSRERANRRSFDVSTVTTFPLEVSTGSLAASGERPLPKHCDKSLLSLIVARPSHSRLNSGCLPGLRTKYWRAMDGRYLLHPSISLTRSTRTTWGTMWKGRRQLISVIARLLANHLETISRNFSDFHDEKRLSRSNWYNDEKQIWSECRMLQIVTLVCTIRHMA